MTALWHELLDLQGPSAIRQVDTDGSWIRFVPGGPSANWTVFLRRADSPAGAAAQDPRLPGLRFELV